MLWSILISQELCLLRRRRLFHDNRFSLFIIRIISQDSSFLLNWSFRFHNWNFLIFTIISQNNSLLLFHYFLLNWLLDRRVISSDHFLFLLHRLCLLLCPRVRLGRFIIRAGVSNAFSLQVLLNPRCYCLRLGLPDMIDFNIQ